MKVYSDTNMNDMLERAEIVAWSRKIERKYIDKEMEDWVSTWVYIYKTFTKTMLTKIANLRQ